MVFSRSWNGRWTREKLILEKTCTIAKEKKHMEGRKVDKKLDKNDTKI